ncbi:hypothetical protein ScPMuIL_017852 [Solemya velum]
MTKQAGLADEWSRIRGLLVQELKDNDYIFQQAKFLSYEQISTEYNEIADVDAFMDVLENTFQKGYLVEFLRNLTDYMNLHAEHGTIKLADCFRGYEGNEMRREPYARTHGFLPNQNFVGRKSELEELINLLDCNTGAEGSHSKSIGVSICGSGGMGKTALAVEMCYRLHQTDLWTIGKVDLREKYQVSDLLRDTLRVLDTPSSMDDVEGLKDELFGTLRQTKRRTLLFFDNIEGVIWSDGESLRCVLCGITELLIASQSKVKILLTTREKIILPGKIDTISNHFVEHELRPLTDDQAKQLLQKSVKPRVLSDPEKTAIVSLCGKTPLAIIMIAGTLRTVHNDCSTLDMIETLQAGCESDDTSAILHRCFHTTFSSLHSEYRKKLVRLVVFQMAPFDMRSAMYVMAKGAEYSRSVHKVKNDLLYLKCRHLVETDALLDILQTEESLEDNKTDQKSAIIESKTMFSLHPLVYEYLKKKCVLEEYKADVIKSQLEFQKHFNQKVQAAVNKYRDDPMSTSRIIEENRVHFAQFFCTLTEIEDSHYEDVLSSAGPITGFDVFWLTKQLPEIANLVLHSDKKIEVFLKMANNRKNCGHIDESFLWDLEVIKEYITAGAMDLAETNIKRLHTELTTIISQIGNDIQNYLGANFIGVRGLFLWKGQGSTEKYKQSLDFFEKSMSLYEKCSPKERFAAEKAEIVNYIGCVHFNLQDYEKSVEYHQMACDVILKEMKPKDNVHFDLPTYLANIGCVWHIRGNNAAEETRKEYLQKALDIYNRAVCIDRNVNISTRVRHANLLKNRSDVYYGLEKYGKALDDAKKALDLRKTHYGEKASIEVITSLHQVGYVLVQMGREAVNENEATAYFRQAETYYDSVREQLHCGGCHVDQREYNIYKKEYFNLLGRLNKNKLKKVEFFFTDYEEGRWGNRHRAIRSVSSDTGSADSDSNDDSSSDSSSGDTSESRESSEDSVGETPSKRRKTEEKGVE